MTRFSTSSISSTLILPVLLVTTVLSIFVFISIKHYRESSNIRTREFIWEDNKLYKEVDENVKEDCYGDWMLPDWLQQKKKMIFPKKSIVKGECVGRGQFGCVFKGKLVQGNAVYVQYINLQVYFPYKSIFINNKHSNVRIIEKFTHLIFLKISNRHKNPD